MFAFFKSCFTKLIFITCFYVFHFTTFSHFEAVFILNYILRSIYSSFFLLKQNYFNFCVDLILSFLSEYHTLNCVLLIHRDGKSTRQKNRSLDYYINKFRKGAKYNVFVLILEK